MLTSDEVDFPVEVVGEFTDWHLEILADLLIDLHEAQQEDAQEAA